MIRGFEGRREPVELRILDLFVVEGVVHSRTRAGLGSLRVQLVEMGPTGETELGEIESSDGRYRITFSETAITGCSKFAPDLQVHAFRGSHRIGSSDVRYNASDTRSSMSCSTTRLRCHSRRSIRR